MVYFITKRRLVITLTHGLFIVVSSLLIATYISSGIYHDYFEKQILRLHTADLKKLADNMTTKLNFFLDRGDADSIQSVLDANFGLFGFVVTDCMTLDQVCAGQHIVYTSSKQLAWYRYPTVDSLANEPFASLRRLPPITVDGSPTAAPDRQPGQILGRLYVIRNIPHTFAEDYRLWLSAPLKDVGVHNYYMRTVGACLSGGLLIWFTLELLLRYRRLQQRAAQQREEELVRTADTYLKQLTDKDSQLTRLDQLMSRQFERYVAHIRDLEKTKKSEEEYRELAEQVIAELEQEKDQQSQLFADELIKTRTEIQKLREKVAEFESSSSQDKREESFRSLEQAVTVRFSNAFEQQIYENVSSSPRFQTGEWRMLSNFDVAVGRNYRQFTDFILINQDSLIIVEAKYYLGTIESKGDFLNDVWISNGSSPKKIDSLWGENPYHQLNEYCMSLMKLLKQRSPWNLQVYGIIVFPDEANITKLGEQLGRFYRVTSLSRLLTTIEKIHQEAQRHPSVRQGKRPPTEKIEYMLRGRQIAP